MKETELKPCPFCGSKAKFIEPKVVYVSEPYWRVQCHECFARGAASKSKEGAKSLWNRRADNDQREAENKTD